MVGPNRSRPRSITLVRHAFEIRRTQGVDTDGLRFPFQLDCRTLDPGIIVVDQTPCRVSNQQVVSGVSGGRLDASRGIHRVADNGEVKSAATADCPRDDSSRVDADADAKLTAMALHRFDDVAACRDRTTCMVGLAVRSTEHCEQTITDELVRVSSLATNDRNDLAVE